MMNVFQWKSIFIFFLYQISSVSTGAIQITSDNIDSILSSNEVVLLNYYANWCRFSQMLNPIYDELADKISKEFRKPGLVAIGKVDCDSQPTISTKYHVNKYPTLKLYRHGIMVKKEYRGSRQLDPLFEFVRQNIQSAIINISTENDLSTLDQKKRYIVGHFDNENSENYKSFSKVAGLLRDECHFVASTNIEQFKNLRSTNDVVYYRPTKSSNEHDQYFTGLINDNQLLYSWSNEKCVPLVREITFENAEELTDEGLPFLILFHHINDHESVAIFEREVAKQLIHETSSINCLHADGEKFSHPLQHLGKTTADLPLLAIDSFRHMFLFPDFKQISVKGKLLQFVKDLHSEKLHKDFHNPSGRVIEPVDYENVNDDFNGIKSNNPSSPPDSVFVRLSPSRQRYSFRDEL